MKCPVCPDTVLLMSQRQGVEIDYCPNCRGIWLDRGELDKLVQLSASQQVPNEVSRTVSSDDRYREKHHHDSSKYHHGHRKKSWLAEIFD